MTENNHDQSKHHQSPEHGNEPFDPRRFEDELTQSITEGIDVASEETLHLYLEDDEQAAPGHDHSQAGGQQAPHADGGHTSHETRQSIVRTAQVSGPLRVRISNQHGDVAIKAIEGLTEARAELRSNAPVDLAPHAPQFRDGELWVEVPQLLDADGTPAFSFSFGKRSFSFGSNRPAVVVALQVPAGSAVEVGPDGRKGDISLQGRFGPVELRTGQGDITVDEAEWAHCSTGSGDISVRRVHGDLKASTGSGDISVSDNTGKVSASTGSGDVSVRTVQGDGKLSTGSGDLTVETLDGRLKMSSGSGDFTIREIVSGAVQAQTASGDITFGVRPGVPVWTDCNTMTGEVSSSLRGAGQPTEGQPYIEIKATTVSGDISLSEV